jgi:TonB family protein
MFKKSSLLVLAVFVSLSFTFTVLAQEETKKTGEVDRLVDDLKSKNETIPSLCLETCDSAKIDRQQITGGEIIDKVQPEYPVIAITARATGDVEVLIAIDQEGKVIAAHALGGHPLLQAAAVSAARASSFKPFLLDGKPVKVRGILTYSFVLN